MPSPLRTAIPGPLAGASLVPKGIAPTPATAPLINDCASTIRLDVHDSLGPRLSLFPLTWILADYNQTVLPFTTYLGIVLPLPCLFGFHSRKYGYH